MDQIRIDHVISTLTSVATETNASRGLPTSTEKIITSNVTVILIKECPTIKTTNTAETRVFSLKLAINTDKNIANQNLMIMISRETITILIEVNRGMNFVEDLTIEKIILANPKVTIQDKRGTLIQK